MLFASAPISGTDDGNDVAAVSESDRENTVGHMAETVEALLGPAVLRVPGDDTTGIEECSLSFCKRHAVLPLVVRVLVGVPFKARTDRVLLP